MKLLDMIAPTSHPFEQTNSRFKLVDGVWRGGRYYTKLLGMIAPTGYPFEQTNRGSSWLGVHIEIYCKLNYSPVSKYILNSSRKFTLETVMA